MEHPGRTRSQTALPPLPRLERGVVRVVNGRQSGATVSVTSIPLVIGTESSCGLRLSDRRVSRQHCAISLGQRGFLVRDLDSRNGTWHAGVRVSEIAAPPGALIRVGGVHLLLGVSGERLAEVEPSERHSFGPLVGQSLAMRRVFALLGRACQTDVTTLILGETGTGKDLAARALHEHGARASFPFEVLDCGAIHPSLIGAALFGHVEGAYTGATRSQAGLFERAAGGTVFIDEIGELPLEVQPALLRVCEERRAQRIGATEPIQLDVRIIAATHRDLAEEVAAGRFREDLYYRLRVLPLTLPPLRERREDLALLCERLLPRLGATRPGPIEGPPLVRLMAHDWPGNVRELRNVLERALARQGKGTPFSDLTIELDAEGPARQGIVADATFQEQKRNVVDEFERRFLRELLKTHDGNVRRAARASGIERMQLKRLLRKHDLA